MVKIVCRASRLKDDDCVLRKTTHNAKMCIHCDLGQKENNEHFILSRPQYEALIAEMYGRIAEVNIDIPNAQYSRVILGGFYSELTWN